MFGCCASPTNPVNFVPIGRTTASEFNKIFSNYFENLRRFAIYWPILFKLNYVVRTVIANNASKFHEDRLNDGVTIYFIVNKPHGISGTWSRFFNRCALLCAVSVTHRSTVVQRAYGQQCGPCTVYGQPKSKNGNIFQALLL